VNPAPQRILFLESQAGVASLITLALHKAATRSAHSAHIVPVRNKDGTPFPRAWLQQEIRKIRPHAILFLMDAPLAIPDLWDAPDLRPIPKLSLWFDDFMRSPLTLGGWEVWRHWQSEGGVRVAVWDGFWRTRWADQTAHPAHPTHLAADPEMFDPSAPPLFPDCCGHALFLGTLPAMDSLATEQSALPAGVSKLLRETVAELQQAPWPLRPYDLAEKLLAAAPEKMRSAVTTWLHNPTQAAVFSHQVWRWGKRIARVRGLRAITEAAPVAILSGHRSEKFARQDEWCHALGRDVLFHETTHVPHENWGALFRSGKFHVQIFDPQSIHGGIPFRAFECGMAGTPLLTDHRTELEDLFPPNSTIIHEPDPEQMALAAERLMRMPPHELLAQGRRGREHAERHHTWDVRWAELLRLLHGQEVTPL
jgi:hypothetical protein